LLALREAQHGDRVSDFTLERATRRTVPVFFGISSPSGAGKTFSALRLATGIQSVVGGRIAMIDTEDGRGTYYADRFDYDWIALGPPFRPRHYLEALQFAASKGVQTCIIDSFSHEHEGEGGMLEMHDAELDRKTRGDASRRDALNMAAWIAPKRERATLRNWIQRSRMNLIACFRAKEGAKPARKEGSTQTEVVQTGWVPIGGDVYVYEMTASCLIYPGQKGVPEWTGQTAGERQWIKLPIQFAPIFKDPRPLDERHGKEMALWAKGDDTLPSSAGTTAEGAAAGGNAQKPPPPTRRADDDPENEPCWKPVAGSRCKLVAGHAGRCIPGPPERSR